MSVAVQKERERVLGSVTREAEPRQLLVLRLQPEHGDTSDLRVTWDVKVKENKNQRSSKSCCVFHKKKLFGESDTESSSSSSDEGGPARADAVGGEHPHCCGHDHDSKGQDGPCKKRKRPKCTKEHCYCGTRFS